VPPASPKRDAGYFGIRSFIEISRPVMFFSEEKNQKTFAFGAHGSIRDMAGEWNKTEE